jgi:hypothetical protein
MKKSDWKELQKTSTLQQICNKSQYLAIATRTEMQKINKGKRKGCSKNKLKER